MLRRIGLHHRKSAGTDASKPDPEEQHYLERPSQSTRADSEPQGLLLTGIPVGPPGHGDRERSISDVNSVFPGAESQRTSQSGRHTHDPLGLHLVFDPPEPTGDIIFVHGLGGTATKTWSWNRNVNNFWPKWLASENDLSSYRIFTFGYNSDFKGVGTNLNIIDFAKELLFEMLTFSRGFGEDRFPIGSRAIIFVAHSMGGLVVKQAYVLGKHDREYEGIISKIYGILFLATPHRGAQYAKMLNNILSTAPLGAPPKAYLAELDTHSGALQSINEQFRILCGNLALVSFFETLKTNVGLAKIFIVEKESGILGYPQETSSPLDADHHTICKFKSREDRSYISVKNVLKLWALRILPQGPISRSRTTRIDRDRNRYIETILGIREPAEDEINVFRNNIMDGTCQWITQTQEYIDWIEVSKAPRTPQTFWLIGLPATGKTTLATFVVDHLHSIGVDCQYYFFSSGHQSKRTVAYFLRSIASQLALQNEEFRDKLFVLHESSGIIFTSQNQHVIWEKLFEGIIFKLRSTDRLTWVLDAMDEADPHTFILDHLLKIQSFTSIKIFITSRPIKVPHASVAYGSGTITRFLSEDDTLGDIRSYVHHAVRGVLPDDEVVQEDIIEKVLAKASGSFLWVKLALETLEDNWHTQDDIRNVLTEVPKGMEALYERMLGMIEAQPLRLRTMANRILTWTACCWRPLSLAELKVALEPEFKGFVSLEDTIIQICGHFISIDNSMVSLIHITARYFLLSNRDGLPAFIDSGKGHELISKVCLKYLSNDSWRRVFKLLERPIDIRNKSTGANRLLLAEKNHTFLGYATYYWAYHISKSRGDLFDTLEVFFSRYCLSWIEAIALSSNFRYLIRSAQYLKIYAKKRSRKTVSDEFGPPLNLQGPAEDVSNYVQSWANDFIRIVGKFGPNLLQSPSSIYRLMPPFCPRDSMIGRTYGTAQRGSIVVTGLPSKGWDDCLASVSVGEDQRASSVLTTDAYFITLISSSGIALMWYAETCELARKVHHGEYVALMALNRPQTLLATAGIQTYRIWDIALGREMFCLPKIVQALTMAIAFGDRDWELIIGLDDCSITCYDLRTSYTKWRFVMQSAQDEYQSCPRFMTFSLDLKKVAIAWRGKPPVIWNMSVEQNLQPQRCKIRNSTDTLCAPESIVWQPDGNSILILCQNTKLVEWHLYSEEQIEHNHIKCKEMSISRDGEFLLTSDNVGTMSVWTFPRLNLIYQLVNQNEFIRDLTFSPDGQRFYDIRGSMCNVWEPDALVRPDEYEFEDHSSFAEGSTVTDPTISYDESSGSQVTALQCDSEDKYYCCGREDGTVVIHEAATGMKVRKIYSHGLTSSVVLLAWSASGRYIVSGDDAGQIVAKRLEVKGTSKWAVFPVFELRLDELVQQLLFSSDDRLLLISTSAADRVWDLKARKELCHQHWGLQQSRRWIEHPLNTKLLIWIDPSEVHTYKWTTLEHADALPTSPQQPGTPVQSSCRTQPFMPTDVQSRIVQWIALTRDKRYLIYETLPKSGHASTRSSGGLHIEFLSTSELYVQHPQSLMSDCIADLAGQVKRLIGTYQDEIVFLDHDYWLCTWRIDAGVNDIQRHFFLPKDWLNPSTLQMSTLNAQGTFFCPKHGEVAIVRHGMRF